MFPSSRAFISAGVAKRFAVGKKPRSHPTEILPSIVRQRPDRIVVLGPQPQHVHARMARCAYRVRPVPFHLLPQPASPHTHTVIVQSRNIGRRQWRRRAQNIFQYVFPPQHHRCTHRIARNRQHARLRQHPAALAICLLQASAQHAGNPGPPRLRFRNASPEVHKGKSVFPIDEIRHRPVVAQHRGEEHAGLGPHRIPQRRVPLRKLLRIGLDGIEASNFQPLPREILGE